MAIPVGTTSRQLAGVARWTLAGVVTLGMLAWWWPGYRSWGALSAGLLAVLVLWLAWRTVSADRSVPGHPFHLPLLIPGLILISHFVKTGLHASPGVTWPLAGGLNISMIFHLGLIALGVMLCQSLLPEAARHVVVLGLCGAAMMGGPAAALVWGRTQPVRTALALLGFAGVGVWLSMLWGLASARAGGIEQQSWLRHRAIRVGCIGVAVAASLALTAVAPLQALLAAGIAASTLFVGGIVFPQRRVVLLVAGGGMGIGVLTVLSAVRWVRAALFAALAKTGQATWFGQGEEAFHSVSAADSGLAVMTGTVGWAGTAGFVVCLAGGIVWLMLHARKGHSGDRGRAIVWTAASGIVAGAMLAPGGLFLPASVAAAAFVWGLLPRMLGRRERPMSGVYLLAGVAGVLLLEGVATAPGLLSWFARIFGSGDAILHVAMGFLLGMLLAWLLGARRWWLGLVGILVAALAGGPGEALQYLASTRTAELRDWLFHGLGCAAAAVPYLLCLGARACESPDAVPARSAAAYL